MLLAVSILGISTCPRLLNQWSVLNGPSDESWYVVRSDGATGKLDKSSRSRYRRLNTTFFAGETEELKWQATAFNLVTNQGIQDILEKYFRGSAYTAGWYIGLVTGPGPTFANADTAASHAGWTEFIQYSEATRAGLVLPAFAGTSGDNSASKGTFTCNNGTNATVSGLFLATASAKSATNGVLYSEAAFTQGDKLVSSGDVLAVTALSSGVTQ